MGEVKRNTEDKFSLAGANVTSQHIGLVNPKNKNYWFSVNVIGYRLNNGVCIGSISTELYSAQILEDFHFAYVHTSTLLVNSTSGSNLNNQVLSMIGDSLREFK